MNRNALLYPASRLLGPPARSLPYPAAYAASNVFMDAVYLGWPAGRTAVQANLRPVLATHDSQLLHYWAQRQFRRYGEYVVDALRLDRLSPQDCFDALETEPDVWPRLRALYGRRPVLFALLHFGNWDVGGGAFTAGCGRSSVLIEPLGHPRLDDAIQRGRDRLGMTPLDVTAGLRPALRALHAGATIAVLVDRPLRPHEPGVDLTFCGRPCRLPTGFARLALATDACVIPLAVHRRSSRRFRFRALLDLDFTSPRSGRRDDDVRALMQGVLDVHERWVRRHPDQWYQFRPFFTGARRGADRATELSAPAHTSTVSNLGPAGTGSPLASRSSR